MSRISQILNRDIFCLYFLLWSNKDKSRVLTFKIKVGKEQISIMFLNWKVTKFINIVVSASVSEFSYKTCTNMKKIGKKTYPALWF